MKTKLVTAIYSKLGDSFPFYGYNMTARTQRFHYSLVSIARTGQDIVCYCSSVESQDIQNVLDQFKIENVTLKEFELTKFPYHERMKEVRVSNPQQFFEFPHEVMWAKYYFLKQELDTEYDYHYWIDAGLSHNGLFPFRYNSGGWDGMSANPETYNFPGIFNPELFNKVNKFVDNKLVNIAAKTIGFNVDHIIKYLNLEPKYYSNLTIGGLVGGATENIEWLVDKYFELGEICLSNNFILDNEQILGEITNSHPDKFNTFEFGTWYHEDFHFNGPLPDFNKTVSFYKFFTQYDN